MADGILAAAMTIGAVNGALTRQDVVETGATAPLNQPEVPAGLPAAPTAPSVVQHLGAAHPWQVLLAILATAPLVTRRRYPLASFWLIIATSQIYHLSHGFDATFTFIACVIAAYSAAMDSPYRALAIGSTLVGAGLIIGTHAESVPTIRPGLVTLLFMIPVGIVANAIHTWRQRVRQVEAEQERARRVAADEERARIARELHDVVTHNVSVMVVQAGAARAVIETSPELAREALLAVEAGGRAAMSELRHVMGLLTMSSDGSEAARQSDLVPTPGLHQLDDLVTRMRQTGVPVELTVTGSPTPLPAGMDLAAYRVVQEALTNTVKHAVGASVSVAIDYGPGEVRMEVADTGGTPASSSRSGAQRGLAGLRDRLAVYGGTLEAGKNPKGGYRVRAVIPVVTS
jgi:signal transduction histidine kinase